MVEDDWTAALDRARQAIMDTVARNEDIYRRWRGQRETLKEIGQRYGISGSRVRQIVRRKQRRIEAAQSREAVSQEIKRGAKMRGDIPIEELELSIRSYNCLKNAQLAFVEDVRWQSDAELLRIPNLGKRSLQEIRMITGPHQPTPTPDITTVRIKKLINDALVQRGYAADLKKTDQLVSQIIKVGKLQGEELQRLREHLATWVNHYDDSLRPTEWIQYRRRIGWKREHWARNYG